MMACVFALEMLQEECKKCISRDWSEVVVVVVVVMVVGALSSLQFVPWVVCVTIVSLRLGIFVSLWWVNNWKCRVPKTSCLCVLRVISSIFLKCAKSSCSYFHLYNHVFASACVSLSWIIRIRLIWLKGEHGWIELEFALVEFMGWTKMWTVPHVGRFCCRKSPLF